MPPRLPITHPFLTGDVHQHWHGKRWWQKPGPWCRFKARLGRRGTMLLTMGWLYVLIGGGELLRVPPFYSYSFYPHIPTPVRTALWMVCGFAAMYFALQRHRASDSGRWWQTDTYGWACLYVPPLIRALAYLGSFIAHLMSETALLAWLAPNLQGPIGEVDAIVPFFVWLIPVWITIICSGWLENPRREFC